jgi:3-oxocholest-4-en-26-oate---CoA ligase
MDFSVPQVLRAIGATRPNDEAVVFRDRRLTWNDLIERTNRLANVLVDHGLGCSRERSELAGHESGQDHLAIYLLNGNEYLEAMLGAFAARVAPLNVNYRYVAEELRYLLTDASATAVVIHSRFVPVLEELRADLPLLRVILQVDDDSGTPLMDGALWYEDALADASPEPPAAAPSPDDLYLLYTGGTTGMPKGVMWRQGDALPGCFGMIDGASSIDEVVAAAAGGLRAVIAPPFMHGAGTWIAFRTLLAGGTVLIPSVADRLDPDDVWGLIEREQGNFLLIVGDAFARPLIDGFDGHDASTLAIILSGGAALNAENKRAFMERIPTVMVIDGLGSSEAGGQMSQVSAGGSASTGTFQQVPGNHVLSDDLTSELAAGHDEVGWLAKSGRLALGYLGDVAKTARTYPVVAGVRYCIPGDRARLLAGDLIELHGRDSQTINSGGEKIFAEEVENAVKSHPGVYDCVVAGRPSERWGSEVVAIVRRQPATVATAAVTDADLLTEAEKHIARYKLPKSFIYVDDIVRSPSGKADYRWAKSIVTAS